jgi:DNA-directed RNA polymerase subunit N (RpoN/RPB10)
VSAEVIPIRKQTAADEAWSSYAAMVREMVENPALMHDRSMWSKCCSRSIASAKYSWEGLYERCTTLTSCA